MTIISGHTQLPQGKLAYLQNSHASSKPQVLALHGWLDNAASFLPLMSALPDYNWTAIDLPGHGHSFHRPKHCHYHFIDWISDLVAFHQAQFGEQKVYVVGHSLGGMLATVLAGLYPELVRKLVLIDAAGLVIQDDTELAKRMRQALDSRNQLKTKEKRIHQNLDSAVRARSAAGDITQDSARLLVERNMEQSQAGFEWRTDQRLRAASPVRINQLAASDIIQNIQAPTLICMAELGYASMRDNLARFRPDYPNLVVNQVEGGHHCHMDKPASTAKAIADFF